MIDGLILIILGIALYLFVELWPLLLVLAILTLANRILRWWIKNRNVENTLPNFISLLWKERPKGKNKRR